MRRSEMTEVPRLPQTDVWQPDFARLCRKASVAGAGITWGHSGLIAWLNSQGLQVVRQGSRIATLTGCVPPTAR